MALVRSIAEHRPTVLLIVLVTLSLVSLASGTPALVLSNGVRTVLSLVADPFARAGARMSNALDYATGLVVSYEAAFEENAALRRHMTVLQGHVANRAELAEENERLRRFLDFERNEPRLALKPAEVIGRYEGTLIIDRGSVHGVKQFMCALMPRGIVGVVTRVEPFRSYVFTLHNPEYTMFAMTRRNRVRGKVQGSGGERYICKMEYIDLKDDIRPGDEVVTSPESVFPGGYPIGTVTDVDDRGPYLKTASILPAVNPYEVDEVFVVYRTDPAVSLLTETTEPPSVPKAGSAEVPDDRTLQERLAP